MTFAPVGLYSSGGRVGFPSPVDEIKKADVAETSLTVYDTTLASGIERNKIPNIDPKVEQGIDMRNKAKGEAEANSGEKPDFATINLMKNSFPEPMPEKLVTRYDIETYSPVPTNKETMPPLQQPVNGEIAPQDKTVKNAVRDNTAKLQNNEFSRKVAETPSEFDKMTERLQERNSASTKPAEEIAEKETGSKLTPSQERGFEEYLKNQNTTNAITMTNAAAQAVA